MAQVFLLTQWLSSFLKIVIVNVGGISNGLIPTTCFIMTHRINIWQRETNYFILRWPLANTVVAGVMYYFVISSFQVPVWWRQYSWMLIFSVVFIVETIPAPLMQLSQAIFVSLCTSVLPCLNFSHNALAISKDTEMTFPHIERHAGETFFWTSLCL